MKTWIIGLLILLGYVSCAIAATVTPTPYGWPTPSNTPFPFFPSVTVQPTSAPPIAQAYMCFQDYASTNGVVCGQNITIPAGNNLAIGVSVGPPSATGHPQGPFPATITEVVNGTKYSNLAVDASTGFIGWATLSGSQRLSISFLGTPSLLGAVQTVSTQ